MIGISRMTAGGQAAATGVAGGSARACDAASVGRQATEVAIAVHALNHMLALGRPNYVRIA